MIEYPVKQHATLADAEPDRSSAHFSVATDFFINDVIGEKYAELILKPLRERMNEQRQKGTKDTIRFFINSVGGRVDFMLSTLAYIDECAKLQIPTETIIVGYAFSAASMIAISGAKRSAYPSASLMFHSMRSSYYAYNAEMMNREAQWYEWMDKEGAKLIESRTNIKNAIKLMQPDLYYVKGAAAMKKLGCIDHIL